jgi:hypothetical protein
MSPRWYATATIAEQVAIKAPAHRIFGALTA